MGARHKGGGGKGWHRRPLCLLVLMGAAALRLQHNLRGCYDNNVSASCRSLSKRRKVRSRGAERDAMEDLRILSLGV